jgi:hypothetical protein
VMARHHNDGRPFTLANPNMLGFGGDWQQARERDVTQ